MSYGFIKNAPFHLDESNFIYRLMKLFQWGLSDAPDEHELRGEPVVVFHLFFWSMGSPSSATAVPQLYLPTRLFFIAPVRGDVPGKSSATCESKNSRKVL